jgi:hypothetical protein
MVEDVEGLLAVAHLDREPTDTSTALSFSRQSSHTSIMSLVR